jgi:hypothetical protein
MIGVVFKGFIHDVRCRLHWIRSIAYRVRRGQASHRPRENFFRSTRLVVRAEPSTRNRVRDRGAEHGHEQNQKHERSQHGLPVAALRRSRRPSERHPIARTTSMFLHVNPFAHTRTCRDDTPMRHGCNAGSKSAERVKLARRGSDAENERRCGGWRGAWLRRIRGEARESNQTCERGVNDLVGCRWGCDHHVGAFCWRRGHLHQRAVVVLAVVLGTCGDLWDGCGRVVVAALLGAVMRRDRVRRGETRHRTQRPRRRQGGEDSQKDDGNPVSPDHGFSIARVVDRPITATRA